LTSNEPWFHHGIDLLGCHSSERLTGRSHFGTTRNGHGVVENCMVKAILFLGT